MSHTLLSGVSASAGAKVMITGGYLVLERPNTAVVLSVDARMHSSVFTMPPSPILPSKPVVQPEDKLTTVPIVVLTPQRTRTPLHLELTVTPQGDLSLQGPGLKANTFVAITLRHTFQAIYYAMKDHQAFVERVENGLIIHIRGDRSFYSAQPAKHVNTQLPNGVPQEVAMGEVRVKVCSNERDDPDEYTNKTGLGSSAALVSSLVASLFAHFELLPTQGHRDTGGDAKSSELTCHRFGAIKNLAYRVAQLAHCDAQGKVGSGFDVAVAFFGTQVYTRFSPDCLGQLLGRDSIPMTEFASVLAGDLEQYIFGSETSSETKDTQVWDDVRGTFKLPPGFRLLLGDVKGGSETPGMVRKILDWKKNDTTIIDTPAPLDAAIPTAPKALWASLGAGNSQIAQLLGDLEHAAASSPEVYASVIRDCATKAFSQWSVASSDNEQERSVRNLLIRLRNDFLQVRARLRALGEASDVPVEPPTQTQLLDRIMTQSGDGTPGVLMAGVPGAGGYDAVFVVILDPNGLEQNATRANQVECPAKTHVLQVWAEAKSSGDGTQVHQLPVDIDEGGIKCVPTARVFDSRDIDPELAAEASQETSESASSWNSTHFIKGTAFATAAVAVAWIAMKFASSRRQQQ